jgi:hypothetical protein
MPNPIDAGSDAWPPERLERLADALLPLVFTDRAAPAPAPTPRPASRGGHHQYLEQ